MAVGGGTAVSRAAEVERAVLASLAYSDVFSWPLTEGEVLRGLAIPASPGEVAAAVSALRALGAVSVVGPYVVVGDRPALVEERRRREAVSARTWRRARRAGAVIARLPFVRFVAVSGSLAVSAADEDDDIDLFVVTAPGRLWTARAIVVGVVRVCSLTPGRRARLCPNYLVASTHLALDEQDVFTAHELANLVPLGGDEGPLWSANRWVTRHLPNLAVRFGTESDPARFGTESGGQRGWSGRLSARWVDRFERWEMERKVRRLRTEAGPGAETRYDASTCKGHVDGHHHRILAAYRERLARLGVEDPP